MRELKFHFLDVGHGDTTIIEIPMGKEDKIFGVVDCVKFEDKVKKYLEDFGAEKLAFVVATHPHDDHIDGIVNLLEAYVGKVGEFWDSGYLYGSPTYMGLLSYLDKHDEITGVLIDSGNIVRFGKTRLSVLAPPDRLLMDSNEQNNINNASIVIRVEYGESKILLSGDAQFGSWAHMRINHPEMLKAHVLKVAHHGSKHGNFLEALELVSPIKAVISAGSGNPQLFPHKYALETLREVQKKYKTAEIYNTADVGNVVMSCKGSWHFSVETES